MRDKLTPVKFDDVHKHIHGHATFELFDAETGELVQKIEKDNLVTEAVTRLVDTVAGGAPDQMSNLVMPIATKALGGLMLFNGTLDEDESNYTFPMNVDLVAWGARGTNTSNTKAGSLNAAESGAISGGYRSVWDFGTSQANGTIYAAALSNSAVDPFVGFADVTMHDIINGSGNTWPGCAPIFSDGEYVYLITTSGSYTSSYNSQTRVTTYYNTLTINVYKERIPLTSYKVADGVNKREYPTLVRTHTVSITTTGNTLLRYDDCKGCMSYDYNGNVYFVFPLGNAEGDGTVIYFSLDANNNFSKSEVSTLSLPNTFLSRSAGCVCYDAENSGTFMYLISYNRRSIYIVNLDMYLDAVEYNLPEGFYFKNSSDVSPIRPIPNGGVKIEVYKAAANGQSGYYDHYNGYIDLEPNFILNGNYGARDNQSSYFAGRSAMAWDYDHMMIYGGYSQSNSYWGHYGRPITNYLGTIANLSSPIVKNASQTLKVTYELYDD